MIEEARISDPLPGLRRALLRRRLQAIDLRLRLELAAIVILIDAFLFWQIRLRLASVAHDQGAARVALEIAGGAMLLALAGGTLAGARHARQLRGEAPGPAWLALPLLPRVLARQLAWEARLHLLWMAVPAPALILAAFGLVPHWWLGALAGGFVWMLLESGRLGCALAWRIALRGAEARPGLHPLVRLLATSATASGFTGRARRGRWVRAAPWRALWSKDLLLTLRPTPARRRALAPLAFAALSWASWTLAAEPLASALAERFGGPLPVGVARVFAFGLALMAAASLGEWLIALSGTDPFPVLRTLPIGATTVWISRAVWVVMAAVVLAAGHLIAARPLHPEALGFFLMWTAAAALALGLLAIHYGLTLYPHETAAQRIYTLSLGLAIAASLMIPLMGWVVLLTAVVHSARRLPRWSRLEAES